MQFSALGTRVGRAIWNWTTRCDFRKSHVFQTDCLLFPKLTGFFRCYIYQLAYCYRKPSLRFRFKRALSWTVFWSQFMVFTWRELTQRLAHEYSPAVCRFYVQQHSMHRATNAVSLGGTRESRSGEGSCAELLIEKEAGFRCRRDGLACPQCIRQAFFLVHPVS